MLIVSLRQGATAIQQPFLVQKEAVLPTFNHGENCISSIQPLLLGSLGLYIDRVPHFSPKLKAYISFLQFTYHSSDLQPCKVSSNILNSCKGFLPGRGFLGQKRWISIVLKCHWFIFCHVILCPAIGFVSILFKARHEELTVCRMDECRLLLQIIFEVQQTEKKRTKWTFACMFGWESNFVSYGNPVTCICDGTSCKTVN